MNRKEFIALMLIPTITILAFIAYNYFTYSVGEEILLRTSPIDPSDLFRGDYVNLRYEISTIDLTYIPNTGNFMIGDDIYAVISKGEKFWSIKKIGNHKPALLSNEVCMKGRITSSYGNQLSVEWGIESYFVPEGKGRDIERGIGNLTVKVAVDSNCRAIIKELYLDDSIVESEAIPKPEPVSIPPRGIAKGKVVDMVQPAKDKSNVWALTTGIDGNIYGGTGEGGIFFAYDPNTSITKQIGKVSDDDAVYSLATDENGLIYGGTAWNSKFFVYYPHNGSISYLGQPVINGGIICSLTVMGSNVYGSTCDGGDSQYVGSHLFVYNSTARTFRDLGQPVEGERSSKIISGKNGKIYGGTSPNGYVFSYDPGNKSFKNIGQPVHEEATAFPLIAGKNDNIYFSLDESLYMLDPVQSKIIKLFNLSDFIPITGEFFWSLTTGLDGKIYGGTAPSGYLFAYNSSDNSVAVGRPVESEYRIRSLTTGLDGKIYGGTGWGAYLFSYDPYNIQQKNQSEREVSVKIIDNNINLSSWLPGTLIVSPDNRHVAYFVYQQNVNKYFVVVDGVSGKRYDGMGIDTFIFSPDSKRFAYVVINGKNTFVVVDGKEEKQYDSIGKGTLIFSPDSKRVAYAVWVGDKNIVVVDGKEGILYDSIGEKSLTFSPDSNHVAYLASEGGKWFVVVDGIEEKKYNGSKVGNHFFSPDSKRIAYVAKEGDKQFVVMDGKEGKGYNDIEKDTLIFSPNSTRIAYGVLEGNKQFVVVDGNEGKQYNNIKNDSVIFSHDSKRVAYAAIDGGKQFVVVDGKEENQYDGIGRGSIIFSPDSVRMAYLAKEGDKWFVGVDGKEEGKQYDSIGKDSLIFSPDSKRVAYLAKKGDQLFVVVDGKEEMQEKQYDGFSTLFFSPDSKHMVYVAQSGLQQSVIKQSVVIDGKGGTIYDGIFIFGAGKIFFDSPDSFHYMALKDNSIYLVEEKISSFQ